MKRKELLEVLLQKLQCCSQEYAQQERYHRLAGWKLRCLRLASQVMYQAGYLLPDCRDRKNRFRKERGQLLPAHGLLLQELCCFKRIREAVIVADHKF